MAARKAGRKSAKKAIKARKATKAHRSPRKAASPARNLNSILIELGRQALKDGVRQVLEDHGVDSAVTVDVALTKPRAVKKPTKKGGRRR